MMGGVLTVSALVSLIAFPFSFTVALTVLAGVVEPLAPLAIGLLADVLYYTPGGSAFPQYTLFGALVSGSIVFVRKQLRAGIIR